MNYEGWLRSLPEEIVANSLWKVEAYRLSLFVADVGWYDVTKLMQDKRMLALANQLYRALGSISANIAEGYSRGTGKDRALFMNTRSDQRERAATGITKAGTSFQSPSPNIVCVCSPRLFVC